MKCKTEHRYMYAAIDYRCNRVQCIYKPITLHTIQWLVHQRYKWSDR